MRSHQRHAAANFLVGALIKGSQHALVRPALQLFAIIDLGQIPQRGRIGHAGSLAGRHLTVGSVHMARQPVE